MAFQGSSSISYACPFCGRTYLQSGWCADCRRQRRSFVRLKPIEAGAVVPLGLGPRVTLSRRGFRSFPQVTAALNGGLPDGKVLLLSAAPGMGKTTLALALAADADGRSLLVSSEQERDDIEEIAQRCQIDAAGLLFSAQSSVHGVEEAVLAAKPTGLLVIDSLQQIAGAPHLLVDTTARLIAIARELRCPMLITCQVNKSDDWNGPRQVEHLVDGMAQLETVQHYDGEAPGSRMMFTVVGKYRYGPVGRFVALRRLASGRIEE